MIGYGELTIPLIKPTKSNITTISRGFEIKMIESAKKDLLGHNTIFSKMKVEVDATIKWIKVNGKNSFDKSHSYRQIIKALTPKIEHKINSAAHSNNISSTLETELSLLKTPPNKFTNANDLFLEDKFHYANPNMLQLINNKKNNNNFSKQWSFANNDSTANNNSSVQINNISNAHSCDFVLATTIPIEVDPYIKDKTFEFLSKYSYENIAKNTNARKAHSMTRKMITDLFSYMNIVKETYKETTQLNYRLKAELKNLNEDYCHMLKVKGKMIEKKNERELTTLIKVNPSKKYTNAAQIALDARNIEVNLFKSLFQSISLCKDIEIDRFKESKMIISQMSIDDQSIVLLLTIKNIISNYGKISQLVPPQYLRKLQKILAIYDIKEKAFKIQRVALNHSVNTNIRQITEQDDEEDDEEEKEIEKNDQLIRKTLIDNRFLSKVPFQKINGNCYSFGTLKVKAMIEKGAVKLNIGNKIFSVKQFIASFEQIEEQKERISKGQKQPTSKRNSQNNHNSVKTL